MSIEILRVDYNKLRRSEQNRFNHHILNLLERNFPDEARWSKQLSNFKLQVNRLSDAMVALQSRSSLSLKTRDRQTDVAWLGLKSQVKASLLLPETMEAAQKVDAVLSKSPNPTRLKYERAYGILDTLIGSLYSLGNQVLMDARCDLHVAYLKFCVVDFTKTQAANFATMNQRQSGEVQQAGLACTKAWQSVIKYLEAMAEGEMLPGVEEAIDHINVVCNVVKTHLQRRAKMNKNDAEHDEEILAEGSEDEKDTMKGLNDIDAPASNGSNAE